MSDERKPNSGDADAAMQAYKNGDAAAFVVVFEALEVRLFSFLRKQTRHDGNAEDLVQQTFLRMHENRGRFLDGAAVAPWAFAIARRLYIDFYRHERSGIGPDISTDPDVVARVEAGIEANPEEDLAVRETLGRVQKVLENLPDRQRVAWVLVRDQGFSNTEAAEMLGETEMTVRMLVHRACTALRAALAEDGGTK